MMKRLGLALAAVALLGSGTTVASATQWPFTVYMFCDTPAGPGPVLVRPAAWLGRSCYVLFPGGRVYGVFAAAE